MPASESRLDGIETVVDCLAQIVEPAHVLADPGVVVAGMRPAVQVTPGNEQELARILAFASENGLGVLVTGGGTKLGWGNPPSKSDILVSLGRLAGITEFDPENLSLCARAGTSISAIMAAAGQAGVLVPLDCDLPERATVGGVVATGDQGARRMMYGGVRDVVLGLKAVLADGSQVAFGGRTMKNVTGYDLTKLFVGSFGSLGVITEVTFRLLPCPAASGLAVLQVRTLREARTLVEDLLASPLEPVCLEVLSPGIVPLLGGEASEILHLCLGGEGPTLLAGFQGHSAAVERSLSDLAARFEAVTSVAEVPAATAPAASAAAATTLSAAAAPASALGRGVGGSGARCFAVTDAASVARVYRALAGLRHCASQAGLPAVAKVDLPLSEVWDFTALAVPTTTEGPTFAYRVSAGSGCVQLYLGRDEAADGLGRRLVELRGRAEAAGGHLVVMQGGETLGADLDVWGDIGSSVGVMKALKARFDPDGILNPGRFVGGL